MKLRKSTTELLAELDSTHGSGGLFRLAQKVAAQTRVESPPTSGALVILRAFVLEFARAMDGTSDPDIAEQIAFKLKLVKDLVEHPSADTIGALSKMVEPPLPPKPGPGLRIIR